MTEKINKTITIPEDLGKMRLDQALTRLWPDYSRTQIQEWIKNNKIQLNHHPAKSKQSVFGGETIILNAELKEPMTYEAQPIPLDIVYEDEALIVINKPAGMVVHPAAGNPNNTLLNALLHHCPELNKLPRAGILHRIDKNTSGLLVIAKTSVSLKSLSKQLKAKTLRRIYTALVQGELLSGGTVDAPISRHPIHRKQMAVIEEGKRAVTHYRVLERFQNYTLLKIQLETGRTHQIRVHMQHIRYPIFGDPTYGPHLQLPKGASDELIKVLRGFKRQALHASELGLVHPLTGKEMTFKASLPEDIQGLVAKLQKT